MGDVARAARCAFWLAFSLLNSGHLARGGGWIDRALRLLDDRRIECVERGYLRYASAMRATFSGNISAGYDAFHAAVEIGTLFRDAQLVALARIGEGRCLIHLGRIDDGLALLDEGIVAIESHDVSAIAVGDAYCTVIDGCNELMDIERTRAWTISLGRWVDDQPELMLYRGQCLLHRAEAMLLRGDWDAAIEQLEQLATRVARPPGRGIRGAAAYLTGELHRLRGRDHDAAVEYQRAGELGRDPQPGLALLRLAEGNVQAAAAAIRRAYREAGDSTARAQLAPGFVEVALAAGDVTAARSAVAELADVAEKLGTPLPESLHLTALGSVLLAEGQLSAALTALRAALRIWHELEAPYEAARTRVVIAAGCQAAGDLEGAEMELAAARHIFTRLGAVRAERDANARLSQIDPQSGVLTRREEEVLAHIAQGLTNRQIAKQLTISEKTAATHVTHILTKLGLPTRSAATAYAFEHGLTVSHQRPKR
ncbi:response regulator transcription factor [Agromyces neolithicus]|uniref:helix-turn-helix transcriptional regulator n=1 Tax=Agromyces neolithicus TaxID=269420 RepID=UPI0031D4E896